MNSKGRRVVGKTRVVLNTKEQKSKTALTPTKHVPKDDPPERAQRQTLRRVLQVTVAQTSNKAEVKGTSFISAVLGTTGYTQLNIKKVCAWSSAGTVSATLTDMPQLSLQAYAPTGVLLEPDFVDRSSQANKRAKAGYYLPERHYGPFKTTDSICVVSTSGVPPTSLVVVEIDAELC